MTAAARGRGTPATSVVVRGATLAGIAGALRLAKAGHRVVLDADGVPFAGHWGATADHPDELPQTFALRAAWMDLFKKSGRAFDAEMTRAGFELVPAPPTRHLFADGRVLDLPAERGAQFHAIEAQFGREAAARWSTLLDRGDDVWFELRMAGLERPFPASPDKAQRARLWSNRSLDDLAGELREPHLATMVRSLAPLAGAKDAGAPALLLSRAVVERQFGRWQVVGADGAPQPAGVLLDLLRERLATRHVELVESTAGVGPDTPSPRPDAVVDAHPRAAVGWLTSRRTPPALAPAVSHEVRTADPQDHPTGIRRVVDHSRGLPVESWTRPLGDGTVAVLTHDHTVGKPDLAWGLAPNSWRSVLDRTPMRDPGGPTTPQTWRASASSPGGNEPWAELLSAALAVYDLHEHLTGADIRPTNKEVGRRPPRTPRPGPAAAAG